MIRLGILQCDNLDEPRRGIAGDYDRLYLDLLAADDIDILVYRAHLDELPQQGECDAWLVPGSRTSAYDDLDWVVRLRSFVRTCLEESVPLVGICFGHQLIAQELGAPVAKAPAGWNIGAVGYQLCMSAPGEDPAGPPLPDTFTLAASHQDQVLALPDGAELLARSPACPIAGFVVGDRVLTVQGHPEFGSELAAAIYDSRRERLGESEVAAALDSLARPLDRDRVANWIINFVRAARR